MELKFPDCLPEDSWFQSWMNLWPTAESPKSFLLFSGMSMLGAYLGREVWLDQDIHKVRPMLNMLLIGPSGIGKSSAVKISKTILDHVQETLRPQFIEGGSTKEKLHKDLSINPQTILFAPELAAFFTKETYKESLIPYVTQLLDYEDKIELRTLKNDVVTVYDPAATIIGGSTVKWLKDQLPNSAVTGGFLARFLIVYEANKGQKVANPHRMLSPSRMQKLVKERERAFGEFNELLKVHKGNIDYEDHEAAEFYANWYNSHEPEDDYLAPFAARAGELILRLAILLAISCKKNAISVEHLRSSVTLYSYIESRLKEVVMSKSDVDILKQEVKSYMRLNPQMSLGEFYDRFGATASKAIDGAFRELAGDRTVDIKYGAVSSAKK